MSSAAAASAENQGDGTLVRDATKSTDGWEKRADGKWYKTDYYKLHENQEKGLIGMEVMERLFVGSFNVAMNKEWLSSKAIGRVLVLGANSGISVEDPVILRVLEVDEENIFDYFDQAIVLIKEALAEHEGILVVCKDQKTFCPLIIVAYLMSVMGWALNTAVERIQSIFKITITGFSLFVLQRWEQVIVQRRNQVTVEKKVIQSPPQTTSTTVSASASQSASKEAPSSGSVVVAQPAVSSGSVYYVAPVSTAPITVGAASVAASSPFYSGYYSSAPALATSTTAASAVNPVATTTPAYSFGYSPYNAYFSSASYGPPAVSTTLPSYTTPAVSAPAISSFSTTPSFVNWGAGSSYLGLGSGYTGSGALNTSFGNFGGYSGFNSGYNGAALSTGFGNQFSGYGTGFGYNWATPLSTSSFATSYPTASLSTGYTDSAAIVAAPAVSYATVGSAGAAQTQAAQMQQLQQQQQTTMVQTTTTRTGSVLMGDASWHSGGVYCHPSATTGGK